jgi:hypothetical protein
MTPLPPQHLDILTMAETQRRTPTRRTIGVAMVLTALFAWLIPHNDLLLRNTPLAGNLLPTNTVLVLLIFVALLNPLLRRIAPAWVFHPSELATLWALLLIPSGIPMAGFWRYILPPIASLLYRASPSNRWDALLLPHAPNWLVVTDAVAVRGFFEGNGGIIPWTAWVKPLSFWVPLGIALLMATICLAALIRRQWTEHEHFLFPLVQLPNELIQSPLAGSRLPPLLTQKPFWVGFSLAVAFHTLCGLHAYFPALPAPPRWQRLGDFLTGFPWDAIGNTFLNLYPSAIGLTYLLATEVAFSLWFFYVLERLLQILFALYGWTGFGYSATDFVQHQQVGAVVGLLVIVLYAARGHWRQVVLKALGRLKELDDRDEPLPYAVAFWGGVLSGSFIVLWLIGRGVSILLAVSFLVMTLGFYLAAAWIASNSGLLMVQMRILPHDPIWAILGSRRFSPRDLLTAFLLQKAFAYDLRETLMPSLLNAMKVADLNGVRRRPLLLWGIALMALTLPIALLAWLRLAYTYGGVNLEASTFQWHTIHPYLLAAQAMEPGIQANAVRTLGMVTGLVVFVGCFALRRQFVNFPLHPMGLIVCRGWAMENFWLMVFVGWLLKVTTMRYGGLHAYKALRPFSLGLVLGDLVMAGFFGGMGMLTRRSYVVLP